MSGLDTRFIPLTILQEQFWDKLNDCPLAGGILTFYQDAARTIPKPVYMLAGNPPDYDYAEVDGSNVITLSSIGTVDDGTGNNLVIYGWPYDTTAGENYGNTQLYYMTVYNSDGQFQFSVEGFPNVASTTPTPASGEEKNLIKNGQFQLNYGTPNVPIAITDEDTNVAYGGWHYIRSSNTATDTVTFNREGSPIPGGIPSGNPRNFCTVACSVAGSDTNKALEVRFEDVNRYSDTVQTLSLYFEAKSTGNSSIYVNLYKNFGTGGSSPVATQIITPYVLEATWTPFTVSFPFGSNVGQTIGANDDDYFSIQIVFPPAVTFNASISSVCMFIGSETITQYPFSLDPLQYTAPHYSAFVANSVDLVVQNAAQPISGAAITLPPGTYMVFYSCSCFLEYSSGTDQYTVITTIYNTTTATELTQFEQRPVNTIISPNTSAVGTGGCASLVQIVTLTAAATLQVYVGLSNTYAVVFYRAQDISIVAVRLGVI